MYNELKKIVNKINKYDEIKNNVSKNNIDYFMEIYSKEEIDLQDLFLALNKKEINHHFYWGTQLHAQNKGNIWSLICDYDLFKPFHNQKKEVYKSLIEILK